MSDDAARDTQDDLPQPTIPDLETSPRTERVGGPGRLAGQVALVSGGASGTGRAVAVAFAAEGADVAILYRDSHEDAQETMRLVQDMGGRTMALSGDTGDSAFCDDCLEQVAMQFGPLDILVNHPDDTPPHDAADLIDIDDLRLEQAFRRGVYGPMRLTRAALPHLRGGAVVLNAPHGAPALDVAASQAALIGFTRSLAAQLAPHGIRVNAVAADAASGPAQLAPSYVFLASTDCGGMTGQVLRPGIAAAHTGDHA